MSFFITGTDTGVGKTVVTAALASLLTARGKHVCVYKPVQTGATHPEDLETVKTLTGLSDLSMHCSYCFEIPAEPLVADTRGEIQIAQLKNDFDRLRQTHECVLVEGAGGVHVPITKDASMIDLMKDFGLPVIVVARPNLGTINHTLLTVEALLARKIPVHGVVVSGYPVDSDDPAVATLPEIFRLRLPVPLLAWVPVYETGRMGVLGPGNPQLRVLEAALNTGQTASCNVL